MPQTAPESWMWPLAGLPRGVRVVFTSREGGVSQAPFDSFNLGDHVRDDPLAVAANRATLRRVLNARPVFLQQVHGTEVAMLTPATPDGTEADACVSDEPGVACAIMVADCLPVVFVHASGRVVAAAHAGWRGLAAGVLERCFDRFVDAAQRVEPGATRASIAAQTWAWLGPCIGPQAFEVGPEVKQAFAAENAADAACFAAVPGREGKFLANLSGLARSRLQRMGVEGLQGNDGGAAWCTASQASRFFSHRRDAADLGSTGRMAACVWIDR